MLRRRPIVCLLALAALAAAGPAHAASLDPAFGADGRVVVDFGAMAGAVAGDMAIQPDGKIVAVGWMRGSFGAVRLLPGGQLDPSFGSGGVVLPSFGTATPERTSVRMALQPDGKIVIAGPSQGTANTDFAVMRLNPDGSPDTSFAGAGHGVYQVGPGVDIAQAVALQPDGKIVVAGYSVSGSPQSNGDFAVIRLTPSGQYDTTFADDGAETLPMIPDSGMDSASAVGLLPDGRILLAGVTARSDTGFDLAAIRLTASGQPDPTFGDQGRAELALGQGAWQEIVKAVSVLPDGSFYIGGAALQPGFGPSQIALTRFSAAGLPDPAFGAVGQFLYPLGTIEDTSNGIVIDGPTTYLAVDSRRMEAPAGAEAAQMTRQVGVLALDGAGRLDTSFRDSGALLFHITPAGNDRVAALARRADGSLIELATVPGPSGSDALGFAAVIPHSKQKVEPPPAETKSVEQPIAPVSAIGWPKQGAKLRRVTVLRGAASGRFAVDRVDIALVRTTGRARAAATASSRCYYLESSTLRWQAGKPRAGKCRALIWLRARGGASWRYTLKRALPKGAYTLYSVATGAGLREAQGKAGAKSRVTFTVR